MLSRQLKFKDGYLLIIFLFGRIHRLNMEVDLLSLFGLHVTCCAQLYSLAETPQPPPPPPPPHWDSHTRALLVSKHRRHLFVTPWQDWTIPSCIFFYRYSVKVFFIFTFTKVLSHRPLYEICHGISYFVFMKTGSLFECADYARKSAAQLFKPSWDDLFS